MVAFSVHSTTPSKYPRGEAEGHGRGSSILERGIGQPWSPFTESLREGNRCLTPESCQCFAKIFWMRSQMAGGWAGRLSRVSLSQLRGARREERPIAEGGQVLARRKPPPLVRLRHGQTLFQVGKWGIGPVARSDSPSVWPDSSRNPLRAPLVPAHSAGAKTTRKPRTTRKPGRPLLRNADRQLGA